MPLPATRPRRLTVAIVGASDNLGSLVVQALLTRCDEGKARYRVLALDLERGAAPAVWRLGPLDTPSIVHRLRGADVVVLLATSTNLAEALNQPASVRREYEVRRAQAVTTAVAAVGARRLIAVTSAMALGARPDNPVPLSDAAVVKASSDAGVSGDVVEVERVLARAPGTHPGLVLTVLRPAAVVGPGVDTVVTRHFEAPRLLALKDSPQPMRWQFCHLADLADAVCVAIEAGLVGPLTVGCPGSLEQAEVEELSGMRRVELPAALALRTAQRLHRVGVLPTPADDLAYVVYPWTVSAQRLHEAGWKAQYDNKMCLQVLLEQAHGHLGVAARRLDRQDAALGAAGAAVALVGTAAMVRRRRRNKRR